MAKVAFGRHKNLGDIKGDDNEYITDIPSEIKLLLTYEYMIGNNTLWRSL
jgi:hypothetical protein